MTALIPKPARPVRQAARPLISRPCRRAFPAVAPFIVPAVGAFTLVELLVATTLTVLLVVVLVQVFNGASSTWRHSEAQVDAYREARGALQMMARDLSSTLQASYAQTGDGTNPPAAGPMLPTLVLQHYSKFADGGTTYADGPKNEEVYCLTIIPNHGNVASPAPSPGTSSSPLASSLCAVGYYCQWMPDLLPVPTTGPDNRPHAFALMRQALNGDDTFLRLQAKGPGNTVPLTFLDLYTRPNTPTNKPVQIAAYVWDLRFRIDTDLNDSSGSVPDGNDPAPPDHSTPTTRVYGGDPISQPYPPYLPPYIEIRFKALSNIAGRRLEGAGTGVTPATWNDTKDGFTPTVPYKQIIQPNYQQFILRVPLTNANQLPAS